MFKNIKSLFVITEEEENDKSAKQPASKGPKEMPPPQKAGAPAPKAPPTSSAKPSPAPTGPAHGEFNDKILDKLLAVLDKNNLEGFDYIEYKKSLQALAKMNMDEKTRFMSAFATAATVGATVEKIMESITFYRGLLEKEHKVFQNTIELQMQEKVGGKEKLMSGLDEQIKAKSATIQKLTAEIQQHQKEIETVRQTIAKDKAVIDKTAQDFKVTYQHLTSQIDADSKKITEYLK